MELIGSLTRDTRSLCVVIYLFQKLEHKFKNAAVLNIGKELFRLINLYKGIKVKINLMYVAQKYLLCNFYTINIEKLIWIAII